MNRSRSKMFVMTAMLVLCVGIAFVLIYVWMAGAAVPELPCAYGFARESSSWNPDVWINGQPALHVEGNGSGWRVTTHFVVDGENKVRITACRNPVVLRVFRNDDCSLKFFQEIYTAVPMELKEIHRIHVPKDDSRQIVEESFTFTAKVPLRWRWQDADDLGTLSGQDRTAILARFNQLASAMKAYDAGAVRSLFSKWRDGPPTKVAGQNLPPEVYADPWDQNMDLLRGNPVFVAVEQEMKLAAGAKIVMLFCPGLQEQFGGPVARPLISADRVVPVGTNQPEGTRWEQHRETVISVLYFVRANGRWHMMMPDCRL